MELFGLSIPLVKPGDDLPRLLVMAAKDAGGLEKGDILVVSSKVVATAEGRMVELSKVKPSKKARLLGVETKLPPEFVEVVLNEADRVLGHVEGAILTVKSGVLSANAGADQSNVPRGFAVLMPKDPDGSAEKIRRAVLKRLGAKVGVVISDSSVKPLRLGTVGQAVGVAGFEPVVDCRGQPDLYGRRLKITFQAVADQLATAVQLLMGEGAEKIPAVVVRGSGVKTVEKPKSSPKVPLKKDIYSKLFK
ncbi:MAG: coenzyme F420-0:L-glutamate ligase [Candidatus Hadarchaeota archaeon]